LDENNDAVVPSSCTWTLTDANGAIVNSREDVSIGSLAETVSVVLSGDDLALASGFSGESEWRFFTIEATYNSDLGVGLPLNDQLKFPVFNLNRTFNGHILLKSHITFYDQ